MQLPFSIEEFLEVFRSYNDTIWPAQFMLYGLGIALVVIARRSSDQRTRWSIAGGLAMLWAWMGGVYHLLFFADINPAARIFGLAFLIQAAIWLIWAWREPRLSFQPPDVVRQIVGWALLAYAFVGYPLLNTALGHRYPGMPTFGAPCPTAIATLGLLTWATPRAPWFVWLVPVLWALIGTSAAFTLGIREDMGLLAAAVLAVSAHVASRRPAAA